MHLRIMPAILLLALTPTLASAGDARKGTAHKRPNILFLFADDWGRYASAYAAVDGRPSPNQVVRTPNIDRLAQRGVLFRNAFVNAPSCTPSRSALLSGRYFFKTGQGAILQGAVWDSEIPSWPLLLRASGYFIGKAFKVWSPGTPVDAPFGLQKHAFQGAGGLYNNFSENATQMIKNGVTVDAARGKLLNEVRDNFRSFLDARPKDQPFCFWFGPTLVHRKWEKGSGKKLWDINADNLKGKLPKFLPDVPEVREDFADYLGEIQAWDAGVGVLLRLLEEAGELENTVIVISGDHGAPGFPGGKCNLYDFGVGVALIACGPGIPSGPSPQPHSSGERGRGGRVVDDFVNLMDLAPTFLEIGGLKRVPGMQGRGLLNVLQSNKSGLIDPERTWVVTGRERHVAAARAKNVPYPQRALRTDKFLYIRNFAPDRWPMGDPKAVTDTAAPTANELEHDTFVCFADMDASPTRAWLVAHRHDPKWKWHYNYAFGKRPAEELYDLGKDPDQIDNVAANPAYADARKELSARLQGVLTGAGDPRVVGDGDTFERAPFTDAVEQKKKKAGKTASDVFARSNLVAWCIVPFDAKNRNPAERAEMVKRLGLARVAYDWRENHVAGFEEEILQYKKHGIEYFAFWATHDKAFELFAKHNLHPQIWHTAPSPAGATDEARVTSAVKLLLPLVERTAKMKCKLGLYNHGGWGGEPANLVAVCKALREQHKADHVGIVYNLHHGHDHIGDFEEALARMQPYLLCLNLNGMTTDGDKKGQKILPLGAGEHDVSLLKIIRNSKYTGPIGIIGHTNDDVEQRLLDNLDGLDWILPQLQGREPGPRPTYRTHRGK